MFNKQTIIDELNQAKAEYTAEEAVDAVLGKISELCTREGFTKLDLRGICSFEVKELKAKQGRNPKTGEAIQIPARKALKVKLARALKVAYK